MYRQLHLPTSRPRCNGRRGSVKILSNQLDAVALDSQLDSIHMLVLLVCTHSASLFQGRHLHDPSWIEVNAALMVSHTRTCQILLERHVASCSNVCAALLPIAEVDRLGTLDGEARRLAVGAMSFDYRRKTISTRQTSVQQC